MAYVVQGPCVNCKYGDCIEECPVDAFHEGLEMLYINPDTCIDCDLCIATCPVNAIATDDDADPKWTAINADFKHTDENQCSADKGKDSVEHGPDWDSDLAN